MCVHDLGKILPEPITATLVDAEITDDGEFASCRGDVNQHRIPLASLGHAQPGELLLSGSHRIGGILVADKHAHLTGGLFFRRTDGRDDLVLTKLFDEWRSVHITNSPLLRRRRSCHRRQKNHPHRRHCLQTIRRRHRL